MYSPGSGREQSKASYLVCFYLGMSGYLIFLERMYLVLEIQ